MKTCRVVSQVGDKFILVVCQSPFGQHLIIIDQHAADERVKLEQYLDIFASKNLRHTPATMETPMVIEILQNEKEILRLYSPHFKQLGIYYHILDSLEKSQVMVTHIPQIAHAKILSEKHHDTNKEFLRRMVVDHALDIHNRHVSKLPVSSDHHWLQSIKNYPAALLEIYKSKACRSKQIFAEYFNCSNSNSL